MRSAVTGGRVLSGAPIVGFVIATGEMFLMSGPFAAYFYGVYSPLLGFVHAVPPLGWLADFWMLHVVPSAVTRMVFALGVVLAVGGIVLFAVHAAYLYWMKLRRKAIATRLLYGVVRHPQYTCLIVSGAGFALLWPRFVNLVLFLAMSGAYYALARSEEERMKRKFPFAYIEYAGNKPMFFPGAPGRWIRRRVPTGLPNRGLETVLLASILAVVTLAGALGARTLSVRHLETISREGDGSALLVAYSTSLPAAFVETAWSIADQGRGEEARLVLISDDRAVLEHLLIDSGVRRKAIAEMELSPGDYYLVRTRLAGTEVAAHGLEVGGIRTLDGIYSMRRAAGSIALSRVTLPEDSLYRHAAVPLL